MKLKKYSLLSAVHILVLSSLIAVGKKLFNRLEVLDLILLYLLPDCRSVNMPFIIIKQKLIIVTSE